MYNEFRVVSIETSDVEGPSDTPETLAASVTVLFSYFHDVATLKVTSYANSTSVPKMSHFSRCVVYISYAQKHNPFSGHLLQYDMTEQ